MFAPVVQRVPLHYSHCPCGFGAYVENSSVSVLVHQVDLADTQDAGSKTNIHRRTKLAILA